MTTPNIRIAQRPPSAKDILRNLNFGHAVGLTKTAKEGQEAVKAEQKQRFTIRNKWQDFGPFAIRIKPATRDNLKAEIGTAADFLLAHEEGRDKTPRGANIAIPTDQVRRNKKLIIPKGQRPKGLGAKVFVLQTKKGPVLAQRIKKGKRKGLIVLYGLEKKARIKKTETFYPVIRKVVERRMEANIKREVAKALAAMK